MQIILIPMARAAPARWVCKHSKTILVVSMPRGENNGANPGNKSRLLATAPEIRAVASLRNAFYE
jgi:hypothetical protein